MWLKRTVTTWTWSLRSCPIRSRIFPWSWRGLFKVPTTRRRTGASSLTSSNLAALVKVMTRSLGGLTTRRSRGSSWRIFWPVLVTLARSNTRSSRATSCTPGRQLCSLATSFSSTRRQTHLPLRSTRWEATANLETFVSEKVLSCSDLTRTDHWQKTKSLIN